MGGNSVIYMVKQLKSTCLCCRYQSLGSLPYFLRASSCFARHKALQRACHYRYFSRPSIIVVWLRWGMLRWAWLKPRMPPNLLQKKWEGREDLSPCSIHLPTALFMCYLVHWLLLRVPSPLLEFYSRCRWIVHVSLYVPQCLPVTAFLCVDDCAWKDYCQPSILKKYTFSDNKTAY